MQERKFEDKYDIEFVNLVLEIDKRIEDYEKSKKLRINSWIRQLCLPTTSIQWKKNRNLYAIVLLDNILNGKLEPPFDKSAYDGMEIPFLSPTVVKSKISKKFSEEVCFDNTNEEIQEFIDNNFYPSTLEEDANKMVNDYMDEDMINPKYNRKKIKEIPKTSK